ncbi:hypothetical protein PENARI_c006G03249 [Penicillium arizonense]|uniref:Uncharacterized protein n=1 Tax=Penicillium arizonense TaxID=1835702 RepID=A0A1F5LN91_PENAI|nr:hypothetical protein PENARI_c006G03249 [Penicillium arizonense]
MAEYLRGQRT